MNSQELKTIQEECRFDIAGMSDELVISPRQYKAYLYGQTRIPNSIGHAARGLLERGRAFRLTAIDRIDAGIKQVPNLAIRGEW